MSDLARCLREQRECQQYVTSGGPDSAGAAAGLGDWIMEESIIRQDGYAAFLESKGTRARAVGLEIDPSSINPKLFPFQRDLTRWAILKGCCAIFADTGLGKTFCQLEWARLLPGPALIIAPLGVTRQTIKEGQKLGLEVAYSRDGSVFPLTITNYEMAKAFDPARFQSVVLDESSILKSLDGKTRKALTEMFQDTPYRLCCTATPAPNDIAEIANHAEFLGIMSRVDMLAMFFVHDDEGWRLKKHATDSFYRWLASWSMSIRLPSDLGYEDDGYILPPLDIRPVVVDSDIAASPSKLFFDGLHGIGDRSAIRRGTIEYRTEAVLDLIFQSEDQCIVWCGLNDEGRALKKKLLDDAVLMEGADSPDEKANAIERFQNGDVRVLITKTKIAGFGMNLQGCHRMIFHGLNDSWESFYQAVRRCYRFGQSKRVEVSIVISKAELQVLENIQRKEREANGMRDRLIGSVQQYERAEIHQQRIGFEYKTKEADGESWRILLGDSCERMKEIPDESVGLSVFSPPFMSLFTYSPTERDLGNSRSEAEFFQHFGFIIDELMRVTKPGRNCCVHVAQVTSTKQTDGFIGLKDFRGKTIEQFIQHGWIYHGDICIDKDPQAQAIRTHSKALLFVQLRKDASWLRPALADYILVFRKPGDNVDPILPDITNEDWIEWARPVWYGIDATDTLNVACARENEDERHICPLQLGTIERCVRLWSNPGDLVLSPFAGIGSEGYVALKNGRKFVGIELKESYFRVAADNLKHAEREGGAPLFANL